MGREEIIIKLKELYSLISSNNVDDMTENADLRTDLGLSSIGMLYLVIAVEEKFGVKFENVSMGDFLTVKDVIDFIEREHKK